MSSIIDWILGGHRAVSRDAKAFVGALGWHEAWQLARDHQEDWDRSENERRHWARVQNEIINLYRKQSPDVFS